MDFEKEVRLLRSALEDPSGFSRHLDAFQEMISEAEGSAEPSRLEEALADLAYDLNFFVEDPVARAEDPSYFGREHAEELIREALDIANC